MTAENYGTGIGVYLSAEEARKIASDIRQAPRYTISKVRQDFGELLEQALSSDPIGAESPVSEETPCA